MGNQGQLLAARRADRHAGADALPQRGRQPRSRAPVRAPGPGCEFLNPNDDGKTYRFDIVCRDPNLSLSGSGEIAYAPDRLAGSLTVRTVSGAQTLDVRSRIEARRLGPCQ
ncbi:MAG: DUF3617 family protein [Betaproteobacteria bacterium]|nr:DUF3617 family protein [Betaproteobacteria bacterium]